MNREQHLKAEERVYESVEVTRDGGVFVIKLHRPEKFNALNSRLREDIVTALTSVKCDDTVRAVVVWGGTEVFAAGADLVEMAERRPMQALRRINHSADISETLAGLVQPTIAAISGLALGGGLEFALAADIRIASNTAVFAQPEVNIGMIPGGGATQRLTRLIGMGHAKEMILLGDRIDANEALRLGLVNKVVATDALFEEAMSMAHRLAKQPMHAMRIAKLVMDKGADAELQQGLTLEAFAYASTFGTADQREGARAFVEKRSPVFGGEPK
jgi:enoyl-CoA hydratase/carnithine racemase